MKKLKRILSIFVSLGIALGICGAEYQPVSAAETVVAEGIADGGFEDAAVGTQIGSSESKNIFAYSVSEAVVSDTLAHSGTHALKMTRNSSLETSTQMSLNHWVSLEQGKKYKISAWVRFAPDYTGKGDFYIRITDVGDDFAWADRGVTGDLSGADDFVKVEAICEPSKSHAKARFNIGVSSNTKEAVVYIDDISCAEIEESEEPPEPGDGNLIKNPGFEDETMMNTMTKANANAERTTEEVHSGNYSYKVEQTQAYGAINYNQVALKAGKSYYFAAWMRLGKEDLTNAEFYIRLFWNGQDNTGMIYSPTVSGADGWILMESVLNLPPDANVDLKNTRFNIAASTKAVQPVTFYLDDVMLKELDDMAIVDAAWNDIGEMDGVPVCPIDAAVDLTFSVPLQKKTLSSDAILLNGMPVNASDVTVTADADDAKKVKIQFGGLRYSKRYALTLADDSWKDEYERSATFEALHFKTSPRVVIDSKKLYIDNTEVTDGKLKNGTVRAEVSGFQNMSGSAENVTAILALFRNGEMIEASSSTTSVTPGASSGLKSETELHVDMDGTGSYMLKLFVWDDLKSGLSLLAETTLQ